ncbi:hypothetical protein Sjap_003695 [Stephania japonica]|uniref:Uncharacterized protein n=1 Tax=Stephania japonica TaxID=461633 RepID=A0AAP0KQ98_9MAGN
MGGDRGGKAVAVEAVASARRRAAVVASKINGRYSSITIIHLREGWFPPPPPLSLFFLKAPPRGGDLRRPPEIPSVAWKRRRVVVVGGGGELVLPSTRVDGGKMNFPP